jgi:hypothetical protein
MFHSPDDWLFFLELRQQWKSKTGAQNLPLTLNVESLPSSCRSVARPAQPFSAQSSIQRSTRSPLPRSGRSKLNDKNLRKTIYRTTSLFSYKPIAVLHHEVEAAFIRDGSGLEIREDFYL